MKRVAVTLVAFTISCFTSCTKEKVPLPPEPVEPTKWEKIAGDYKVYDTLGNYLYEMNIEHFKAKYVNIDSLWFTNIDGNFNFGYQQSNAIGAYEYYLILGHHGPLLDTNGNRWKVIDVADIPYNTFKNDTILLKYRITNINYYLEDLTPYMDTTKIQIAVKKH
ncbi:MAG: hypothetical protein ACK5B9_11610 [Flavobacteriia bacterium]